MTATDTDYPRLIARSRELGPFADDAAAARALAATLEALAGLLTRDEHERFARSLPRELRRALPPVRAGGTGDEREFYRQVALKEQIPLSLAVEHAQVICRMLGELLPEETHAQLSRHLPAIGALFAQPEPAEPLADVPPPAPAQSDLAEGRPGSRHPLADADPARLAHRHSVARNADPHGDSRLATARGLTQEREQETLATGEPGSRRPLSRSH